MLLVGSRQLDKLRSAGIDAATTLHVVVVAAIASALGDCTGVPDVVIHSLTANRTAEGSEDIVGFLAHSVIYRLSTRPGRSWGSYVAMVRDAILSAIEHADAPLPVLIEALQREERLSPVRGSRYIVSFRAPRTVTHQIGRNRVLTSGTRLAEGQPTRSVEQGGIAFDVVDLGSKLQIHVLYNDRLVAASFISKVVSCVQCALTAIVSA